jgi:N-methylhydantoinase A
MRELADRSGSAPHLSYIARMRYRGQGHELEVPLSAGDSSTTLAGRFTDMHRGRYGFILDIPVEVVSARCARSGPTFDVTLARRGASRWHDDQTTDDGGAFEATLRGPCVVALRDATMLVAAGWTARALPIGGWLLER